MYNAQHCVAIAQDGTTIKNSVIMPPDVDTVDMDMTLLYVEKA